MSASTTHTHCHICEQLCGLKVTVVDGRVASIRPDKDNPYTWRDFCVKGQRAGEVAESPWRLRQPMRRIGDRYVPATYEHAVEDIASRLRTIMERHGPNAVAGYLGNPGGFNFGSASFHSAFLGALGTHQAYSMFSIDTNAHHAAAGAMFGLEWLALIPDIDATDCALLIGTNPAVSKFCWLGKVPNGWRRLVDRVRGGAELIVVDPRRTETAERATLHLAPLPEEDWALLLGMIRCIFDEGLERLPLGRAIDGIDALRSLANSASLEALARICDVPADAIADAARRFAQAERAFAYAATGPGLGRNGALAHWLSLALNVITDRIDRPGGRFMPNWPMNQAIYKAQVSPDANVPSRVRGIDSIVGQHSIAELADEITTPGAGRIRALILNGGNPASSSADGGKLSAALRELDLLVAVDLFQRESHRGAHWLIPGQHFLERDELHVGIHALNDRPFIQRARAALPTPEGIRPEWTFYRDLAEMLGLTLFGGQIALHPDAVSEALLAIGGQIGAPEVAAAEHGLVFGERTMGHLWAYLERAGRTIALCPPTFADTLRQRLDRGREAEGCRIVSRRRNGMMNGWLAETSGSIPADPTADSVEIHPGDAAACGIAQGDLVDVRSETGGITAFATLSAAIRPGAAVLVQGWGTPLYEPGSGDQVFRKGNGRNKLVADDDLDPLSAVPRLNGTRVTITKLADAADTGVRP